MIENYNFKEKRKRGRPKVDKPKTFPRKRNVGDQALDDDKPLNHRQILFCKIYAKCLNATEAATKAGYRPGTSGFTASRLMAMPKVKEEIERLINIETNKICAAYDIDKMFVLTNAVAVMNSCLESGDNGNALRALDLIGKHIDVNAFTPPKNEDSSTTNIVNNIIPSSEFRKFLSSSGILSESFINSDEKVLDITNVSTMSSSENNIDYIDLDKI